MGTPFQNTVPGHLLGTLFPDSVPQQCSSMLARLRLPGQRRLPGDGSPPLTTCEAPAAGFTFWPRVLVVLIITCNHSSESLTAEAVGSRSNGVVLSGIAGTFVTNEQMIQGYREALTKQKQRAVTRRRIRTRRHRLGVLTEPFRPSSPPRTVDLLRQREPGGKEAATGETVGIITAVIALLAAGTNLMTALLRARTESGSRPQRRQGGRHRRE